MHCKHGDKADQRFHFSCVAKLNLVREPGVEFLFAKFIKQVLPALQLDADPSNFHQSEQVASLRIPLRKCQQQRCGWLYPTGSGGRFEMMESNQQWYYMYYQDLSETSLLYFLFFSHGGSMQASVGSFWTMLGGSEVNLERALVSA